jgi:methylenetetrahydrofolate reductase (NADPH)
MWNMFDSLVQRANDLFPTRGVSGESAKAIISNTFFELVPLKNLPEQVKHLPAGASVSVTCSPAKGIEHTLDLAADLLAKGFRPTPHIAARLIRDERHLSDLADQIRAGGFAEMYLIAGDAETATGTYEGAVEVLRDLVSMPHGLQRIGISGYPDGHLFLSDDQLNRALHEKQCVLLEAGIDGWVSTQMCFDPNKITSWIRTERANGLTLPIRLGLPGPIERAKLLTMGMRVGVGQSLRYLQKNRSGLTKLITGANYNPSRLLGSLGDLDALGINGLHLFSFNQLENCVDWQRANAF